MTPSPRFVSGSGPVCVGIDHRVVSFVCSQMKTRAESLDADLDALMAAFSEISRLSAEVAIERPDMQRDRSRER